MKYESEYKIFDSKKQFNDNLTLHNNAISWDYLIIILFLSVILLYVILTPKLNNFLKNEYLVYIIIIYCLCTYYRVNRDIINPTNHATSKIIIQDSSKLDDFFQKDEVVDFLKENSKGYRVLDLRRGNGNKLAAFNIETITGYHAVKLNSYNKLYMNQFDVLNDLDNLNDSFFMLVQRDPMRMERLLDLFKMSNVKYIVLNYSLQYNPSLKRVYLDNSSSTYIYELQNYKDRIYFIDKDLIKDKDDSNSLDKWNLRDNVYVERSDEINSLLDNTENSKGSFTIIKQAPGFIEFQTDCGSEQFLFISELDYPGWKLYNKYNPNELHKLYKVNKSFMGFIAPRGSHSFILNFQSSTSKVGLVISYVSYLVILILLILGFYFKRKENINESL